MKANVTLQSVPRDLLRLDPLGKIIAQSWNLELRPLHSSSTSLSDILTVTLRTYSQRANLE